MQPVLARDHSGLRCAGALASDRLGHTSEPPATAAGPDVVEVYGANPAGIARTATPQSFGLVAVGDFERP